MCVTVTSKERVIRAIERTGLDRFPVYFCNRDTHLSDIVSTGIRPAASFHGDNPYRSEWGYILKPYAGTMGQPEDGVLEKGWDYWDTFTVPDGRDPSRLAHLPEFVAQNPDRFKTLCMGISGFTNACFTRGTANFLEDMYLEPELAEKLLDAIFTYENQVIRMACELGVDGFEFYDDFGTQKALFMAPQMFRDMFIPQFRRQFELIHSYGKYVYFHSCGNVWDIIPDLIACGADVLNLNQPDLFGIERLGSAYGGKVCFACPVDHQTVAIHGTQEEIQDYVCRLNKYLGAFQGGWIALLEDYACCGMSEENFQAIKQAFLHPETMGWAG